MWSLGSTVGGERIDIFGIDGESTVGQVRWNDSEVARSVGGCRWKLVGDISMGRVLKIDTQLHYPKICSSPINLSNSTAADFYSPVYTLGHRDRRLEGKDLSKCLLWS